MSAAPTHANTPQRVDLGLPVLSVEEIAQEDRAYVLENIMAHICFPAQEAGADYLARRGYLLTLAAERLFELEDQQGAGEGRIQQQRLWVEQLGGLRRLIDCQSLEQYRSLPRMGRHIFAVGHLTLLMMAMEAGGVEKGGASVSKAIHFIESSPGGSPIMLRNPNTLHASWVKRKAVAHLCAAYTAMSVKWDLEKGRGETYSNFIEARLPQFLGIALTAQHFLTEKASHSRTEALVPAELILALPDLPDLAPSPIPHMLLPSWALDIIKEYRVRVR